MRKKRTDKEIHIHTRFCGEEEFTGKKKSKSKTKQKIIMRIKYEMQEYWRRKKKTATQTIVRKT